MDVPLQEPERYWPLAHTTLAHVLHLKPLTPPQAESVHEVHSLVAEHALSAL